MSKLPRLRSEDIKRLEAKATKIDTVKVNKQNEVEQLGVTTRKHVPGTEPETKVTLEIVQAQGEQIITLEGQPEIKILNPEVIAIKRQK